MTTTHIESSIPVSSIPAVNVASVPQRSPLRYPGGKTWLIPHIRSWLDNLPECPQLLLEPFVGGGVVSLTAVMENLVPRCLMAELDRDVAALWHVVLRYPVQLIERIQEFVPSREAVARIASTVPEDLVDHGFRTLVLNRTRRGGILADGASVSRVGENGKGVSSRWYPETLTKRIKAIAEYVDRISFVEADGIALLESVCAIDPQSLAVFLDPPYTVGGKRAGSRLYRHSDVDHGRLFDIICSCSVEFLMTYDYSEEIVELVRRHGLHMAQVEMKTTQHARLAELLITREPIFERTS